MEENPYVEAEIDVPQEQMNDIKKKHQRRKKKPKKTGMAYEILDLAKTFVVCAIFVFILTRFVIRPVQVDGMSMYPTLDNKEIGIMNVIDKKLHGINRFDVVVVNDDKITQGDNWVKRVIGLPGDTIYAKDDVVYVNGLAIDEPYLNTDYVKNIRARGDRFTGDFNKVTLGDDEYFLMGDNRVVSHDSRAVGPFSSDDFNGKDVYVLYPFNNIRMVRSGTN